MKALLMKLFKRRDEPAQASAPELKPTPAPSAPSKRRYGKGKRRHPAPKGARRINPDQPIIEQARGKR
ncbi:hypothetical protein KDW37_24070 [Burkholderia cenocepacia]|uniref:hypothetical protein n=1 Tax=Burkholderia cenocepacia TaxID=95486 RepID=UPI001B96FC86|nr:hypothetical protein [Burkholderia cenocepacia]MBR8433836.1 hypothetical protein [Burkholderia cenocepacia]